MAAAPRTPTHPSLQRGWIDAPHRQCALSDLALESGEFIRDFVVSYVVHGPDEPGVPTVLGLCAIGSTHHRLDFLIGPGAPLDTNRMRVIVVDPIDWIYQSRAYDAHDVGNAPGFGGNTARALQSIRARTLVVAAALELYNPGTCAQWAAAEIPSCRCVTYDSPWGHVLASAADASTAPLLRAEIRQFLRETYEMTSGTKA